MWDIYAYFGLHVSCEEAAITRMYNRLVILYDPEKASDEDKAGDIARFRMLQSSYKVILEIHNNPKLRRLYEDPNDTHICQEHSPTAKAWRKLRESQVPYTVRYVSKNRSKQSKRGSKAAVALDPNHDRNNGASQDNYDGDQHDYKPSPPSATCFGCQLTRRSEKITIEVLAKAQEARDLRAAEQMKIKEKEALSARKRKTKEMKKQERELSLRDERQNTRTEDEESRKMTIKTQAKAQVARDLKAAEQRKSHDKKALLARTRRKNQMIKHQRRRFSGDD